MKRKFLEDLGIEKEIIDKILDENTKDIGNAKTERQSEIDSLNSQLEAANNSVKERDGQLDDLKKTAGDNQALKDQITQLQSDNKAKDAELVKVRRDGISNMLLTTAKAKNLTAVKALLTAVEEEDDVKYQAAIEKQIKKLAESEDTSFLFGSSEQTTPKGLKPGETGNPESEPDTSKMTYSEYLKYLETHPGE